MLPVEVMDFYSITYPELTTATPHGPLIEEDCAVYEFKTTIGTKDDGHEKEKDKKRKRHAGNYQNNRYGNWPAISSTRRNRQPTSAGG